MSNDTTMRQCRAECGLVKPIEAFYKNSGGKDGYGNICKECAKQRRHQNQVNQRDQARTRTTGRYKEQLVIDHLRSLGIYACSGSRASAFKLVDVVCWGCVRIEVKQATFDGREYGFTFTPAQQKRGVLADLILLVCANVERTSYHLFPADHPVFYRGGRLKRGFSYIPNAKSRRYQMRYPDLVVFTDEMMDAHENAWYLVEEKRLQISQELQST